MAGTKIVPLQIATIVKEQRPFRVPGYQRGYRWTPQMVWELLDDLKDWSQRNGAGDSGSEDGTDRRTADQDSSGTAPYSLQPVIVRPIEHGPDSTGGTVYELVDGQQRLTTILLILAMTDGARFHIEYETRLKTNEFLKGFFSHIDGKTPLAACDGIVLDHAGESATRTGRRGETIDIHHLCKAVRAIEKWLQEKADSIEAVRSELRRAEVLWYQIDADDPRTVFARINSGRIPLTDAELIKAALLSSDKLSLGAGQDLSRDVVAYDWDLIEQRLADDAFWAFLVPDLGDRHNRIEKLLDIVAPAGEKDALQHRAGAASTRLFRRYTDGQRSVGPALGERWDETLRLFRALVEWYEEDEFYHRIGYLRRFDEVKLQEIWKQYRRDTKTAFRDWLDERIAEVARKPAKTGNGDYDLDQIEYGSSKTRDIEKFLLLFNLPIAPGVAADGGRHASGEDSKRDGALRYPFHRHIEEDWSVEHIQAQNERKLKTVDELKEYVKTALETVKAAIAEGVAADGDEDSDPEGIRADLEALDGQLPEENTDKSMQLTGDLKQKADIIQAGLANLLNLHQIENLTLLSKQLNSSLNNGLFKEKREAIIDQDRSGAFIPPETRNVFLKYHTSDPTTLVFWSEEDRKSYRTMIEGRLKPWLNLGRKEHGNGGQA